MPEIFLKEILGFRGELCVSLKNDLGFFLCGGGILKDLYQVLAWGGSHDFLLSQTPFCRFPAPNFSHHFSSLAWKQVNLTCASFHRKGSQNSEILVRSAYSPKSIYTHMHTRLKKIVKIFEKLFSICTVSNHFGTITDANMEF